MQASRRPLVVRATLAAGVKMNIANDVTELIGGACTQPRGPLPSSPCRNVQHELGLDGMRTQARRPWCT